VADRRVKGLLILLMILGMAMTACSPATSLAREPSVATGATVVRFDVPTTAVAAGSVFTVKVQLNNVAGLVGAEAQISYNPTILEVQDADPSKAGIQVALGSFLKPDFVAQNLVDPEQGKISFAAVQLPPNEPVSGSGVLATITFRAKTGGSSPLTFDTLNLADKKGKPIGHVVQNGQVVVNPR
jgi:hypothetical protein